MSITIDKHIPIPQKPSRKSLLQRMAIGDSVLFVGASGNQVQQWYSTPARRLDIKIKTAKEADGTRMWRTK